MSKEIHNEIHYDPHNEIVCDKLRLKELIDKVTNLEAKLAESESKVKVGEFWHSAYQGKQLDYDKVYAELRQLYDKNEELKQQLAEKEDRINRLQFEVQQALSNSLGKTIKELIDKDNQDKISFCIEKLEKVKEYNATRVYSSSLVDKFIDNQIKELKEMK